MAGLYVYIISATFAGFATVSWIRSGWGGEGQIVVSCFWEAHPFFNIDNWAIKRSNGIHSICKASITVAIAGMVEVLPKGTSKAKGVRRGSTEGAAHIGKRGILPMWRDHRNRERSIFWSADELNLMLSFCHWRRALEVLDVDPSEVLALGDGENDVEMMELIRSLPDSTTPWKDRYYLNTA